MQLKKKVTSPECKFNMTPMIDMVFLLLIFFMLVGELRRMAEEAVVLPFAAHAMEDLGQAEDRVIVNITKAKGGEKDVNFIIKKARYNNRDALEKFLKKEAIRVPDPTGAADLSGLAVKIRADAYVEFKHVQLVLLACMKANIWKVSFGVAPEVRETSG